MYSEIEHKYSKQRNSIVMLHNCYLTIAILIVTKYLFCKEDGMWVNASE